MDHWNTLIRVKDSETCSTEIKEMATMLLGQLNIAQAIINGEKQVVLKGRLITLPSPQRSGTAQQQRGYAELTAQNLFDNLKEDTRLHYIDHGTGQVTLYDDQKNIGDYDLDEKEEFVIVGKGKISINDILEL